MDNKSKIVNWIDQITGHSGVFISIRIQNPPKTKRQLCNRCRPVFSHLFRKLLGRHWYKLYHKQYLFIGFQEFGRYKNMHAHFIIGIREVGKTPEEIIIALKEISPLIKMDVWGSKEDKTKNHKRYANDVMIEKIYSKGLFSYVAKEIRIDDKRFRIIKDTLIIGVDVFS